MSPDTILLRGWPAFYWTLGAGLVMSLGYRPYGHWSFTVLGLAAYFAAIRNRSAKSVFVISLLFVFAWCGTLWWWVGHSVGLVSVWLLLTSIEAVLVGFGMSATALWRNRLKPWMEPFLYAFLWIGWEQIRASFPLSGFAWLTTAVGGVDGPWSFAIHWLGEVGTGIVIALLSWLVSRLFTRDTASLWRLNAVAVSALLLLSSFILPGPAAPVAAQHLRVGVVQGGVAPPWQRSFANPGEVTKDAMTIIKASLDRGDKLDFYLMGETAYDRDPRVNGVTAELLRRATEGTNIPVVGGTNRYYRQGDVLVRANEIFISRGGRSIDTPEGGASVIYDKQIPVPYGEYIPLKSISLVLAPQLQEYIIDVIPGEGAPILDVPLDENKVRLAVGLCYEVAYARHMARGVKDGGELLYVPTNNTSFLNSDNSYQQLQILRLRAIESQRWGVQASINGISAVVDATGRVVGQTELNRSGFLAEDVGRYQHLTFAVKSAGIQYWLIVGLGLACWIAGVWSRKNGF
ncbi:apolipoprotein N-acyltransferase [Boudabousia marimammalium]|uniref:Apolipoprotein N-acyltransferase n=1 Tax=Boudabousia marimammalium TaxID=156892 RepID=A0A1Q5PQU3_9ACTO|nr:apolipoprotein N-acyltransferase [Boudabousia marimammalium]OKL49991.1 apolipoprotein N-acyltransferase [Boudabousia marimammalium]